MTPKDLLHTLFNDRSNELAAVTGQINELTALLSDLQKKQSDLTEVVKAIEVGIAKYDELIAPDVTDPV